MPVFVHLTSHRNLPSIRRTGIAARRGGGVWALPVTSSFNVSHQWVRELRRLGGGTIVAVYFRVGDDEPVEIGHYGRPRLRMSAAEAVAVMIAAQRRDPGSARAADAGSKAVAAGRAAPSSPEGYEVVIGRRIDRAEIVRIKAVPQVVGWRHRPGAHGSPPCLCLCCERGGYGVRRLLGRVEEAEAAGRPLRASVFGRDERSLRRAARLAARRSGG